MVPIIRFMLELVFKKNSQSGMGAGLADLLQMEAYKIQLPTGWWISLAFFADPSFEEIEGGGQGRFQIIFVRTDDIFAGFP